MKVISAVRFMRVMSADVVVPVYRDTVLTLECLRSVMAHSGRVLGRLFVVDDGSPEPEMGRMLEALRREEPRLRILKTERNLGFVAAANLGLAASELDCVVLNSDARVTPGWLEELTSALAELPRHAALAPLSNNATMCSVPDFGKAVPIAALEGRHLDLGGLPRITDMPTLNGFCMLLRRAVLREIGLFDRKYGLGYHEENDWCQRARSHGYLIGRANRVLVYHHGSVSFETRTRKRLDVVNERRLVARYPAYLEDNARFEASPMARVAARAVRAQLGLLRVRVHAETLAELEYAKALAPRCRVEVATGTLADACRAAGLALAPVEDPDVECVMGLAPPPGSNVVITVVTERTPLGDPRLVAQLRWSQAVVVSSERQRGEVCGRGVAPERVHVASPSTPTDFADLMISTTMTPDLEAVAAGHSWSTSRVDDAMVPSGGARW